jgi:hypothetical protein
MARVSVFLITAALIVGMVGCGPGGDNLPPSQNLEIRTWYDLNATRNNLAGNHTLMNDLNSTTPGYEELASPAANGGKGWDPIGIFDKWYGMSGPVFSGTFDGQGHEICDLYINRPDEDNVGLFGVVRKEAVIKNIGVVNITVIGGAGVGGLVGDHCGTVTKSYSTGGVSGDSSVGGVVGWSGGNVSDSYFTGTVTGNLSIGGLAGYSEETVSNSYSTGSVSGDSCVGGLVGLSHGTVSNSYSTASVTGCLDVGGLLGVNDMGGTVSKCYSNGDVTGNSSVGGLVGVNDVGGPVGNSFWDVETSGQTASAGGTGKATAEMMDIAIFSEALWNIIAVALNETNPACIWNIVNNVTYPFLSWQS